MNKINVLIGLITFSFFLFSCTGIVGQNNYSKVKNDLSKLGLKGKVKSLTETTFFAVDKFGEIQKGNIMFKSIYLFNEKGNKTESIVYFMGKIPTKMIYKNDYNGNTIESNTYEADGSFSGKSIYKYDITGNIIMVNLYESDGSLKNKWIYKYDDKGNEIEGDFYKSDGSLDKKTIYKYDGKGNEIERAFYKSDGSLSSKSLQKYDYKGFEIERGWYKSDGSFDEKYTYNYTFDVTDNWIKKIELKNTFPQSITEREIEYY